ncbi:alkaline phosphatase [Sphaerotilus sp.]|uniref:alkaline phosphatase n=1 Tax=Sphaerotilus sp. TaxID=2093942 RepID=UPI0034E271B1
MQRSFLGAALAASLVMYGCGSDTPLVTESTPAATPKNVLFFLGDGYGIVPMTAARIYAAGEDGELEIDKLPETAFVKTYSLDAQVTDSAPSMAAYMTGVKTRNEVLAMDGDTLAVAPGKDAATGVSNADNKCPATGNGQASATLLELAIAKGLGTGVVSTARLTHATPAATYAHVCHRNAEYEIARQAVPGGAGYNNALGNGVDVLMGGISQYWRPYNATTNKAGRPDGRDLVAELQGKGYAYASDLASFNAVPTAAGTRLIALFDQALSEGHMSYELDRDSAKEPSLAEMTTKAIDVLAAKGKGYFLMVEGGRIDHALHGTNAARALADAKAFDDAIKAGIARAKLTDPELKNTLIVVTADHDHTMVMNGYSALAGKTTATNPGILGLMRDYAAPTTPALDADGKPFTTLVFGNGENRVAGNRSAMTALTDAVVSGKGYHQEAVIQTGVGGETHGGGDVFLGATGLGADLFHGVIDNTAVFKLVRQAVGL